jgi:hypothetical protein
MDDRPYARISAPWEAHDPFYLPSYDEAVARGLIDDPAGHGRYAIETNADEYADALAAGLVTDGCAANGQDPAWAPGGEWATPQVAEQLRARIFIDLNAIPEPEPLVVGWLNRASISVLYGPPKAGKTHVAVALALSAASGVPWLGAPVVQSRVLYVAGEGLGGLRRRVRAWEAAHNVSPVKGVAWLGRAVQLAERTEVDALGAIARELDVSLVVLDTLARCAVGLDENSARDMGRVVAGMDRVRDATGAHVLAVHHTGKDATRGARGSNALLGAVDTAIEVDRRPDGTSTAVATAQRDSEPSPMQIIDWRPIGGGIAPNSRMAVARDIEGDGLRPADRKVLSVLTDKPQTVHQIGDAVAHKRSPPPLRERTIYAALRALVDRGLAAPEDRDGHARRWVRLQDRVHGPDRAQQPTLPEVE